jgi:hypothetical protein
MSMLWATLKIYNVMLMFHFLDFDLITNVLYLELTLSPLIWIAFFFVSRILRLTEIFVSFVITAASNKVIFVSYQ